MSPSSVVFGKDWPTHEMMVKIKKRGALETGETRFLH